MVVVTGLTCLNCTLVSGANYLELEGAHFCSKTGIIPLSVEMPEKGGSGLVLLVDRIRGSVWLVRGGGLRGGEVEREGRTERVLDKDTNTRGNIDMRIHTLH